jgi:hypothetical protein
VSEERAFIENWWKRKFSMPNLPTDDDVIMVSHVLELLKAFRVAVDAKSMTGPTEKRFLEAWWPRKFPANPLKWGSVLRLADAEELLVVSQIHRGRVAEEREEAGETYVGAQDLIEDNWVLGKDTRWESYVWFCEGSAERV